MTNSTLVSFTALTLSYTLLGAVQLDMTVVGVVTELGWVMEQERVRGEPDTNTDCEADTITSGLGTAWSNEDSRHHNICEQTRVLFPVLHT